MSAKDYSKIKPQEPGTPAIQGIKPFNRPTDEYVIGYFTPGSPWVRCIGEYEYLLYKEWEPQYSGVYKCRVLECNRLIARRVLIPIEAVSNQDFWDTWDLTPFWTWVKRHHPDEVIDREKVEQHLKNIIMYNGISLNDGALNLFAACRDGVAFTDSLSKEDADKIWERMNNILRRRNKPVDVHGDWRDEFIQLIWDNNFRHFFSHLSSQALRSICNQNYQGCQYLWTLIHNWDYTPVHDMSKDNFMIFIDLVNTPRVYSSMSELKKVPCSVVFADCSSMESDMYEALYKNRDNCANYTLLAEPAAGGTAEISLIREIAGSYSHVLMNRGDIVIFKYGNCYLNHPAEVARRERKRKHREAAAAETPAQE